MRKYLTFMVIPHNESHVKEFHLSRPVLWTLFGSVSLFIFSFIFYALNYYFTELKLKEVYNKYQSLQIEFSNYKEATETYDSELKALYDLRSTMNKKNIAYDLNNHSSLNDSIKNLTESSKLILKRFELYALLLSKDTTSIAQISKRIISDNLEFIEPFDSSKELQAHVDSLQKIAWEREKHLTQALIKMKELQENHLISSKTHQNTFEPPLHLTRSKIPSISPIQPPTGHIVSYHEDKKYSPFFQNQRGGGIEITSPKNLDIVATADGTISTIIGDSLGFYMIINHNSGYTTIYGQLASQPPFEIGTTIKQGQTIGKMNPLNVGQPSRLHYSILKNNKELDPMEFLSSASYGDSYEFR